MDLAAKGTCEWLLNHPEYIRWAGCDGGLLWIKGTPGSGKSTLLKYILDQRSSDRRHLHLSFFFHGRGNELQRTTLGLFRSLLHQILHYMPKALPDLLQAFKQMQIKFGAKLQWYAADLYKYLESSLSKVLQTQSVYIFVDALDECDRDDAARLLLDIQRLLDKVKPPNGNALRICLACRHQPEWKCLPEYEIVAEQQNRADISIYVQAQLSNISANFSDLVVKGAGGNFLWAHLAVKRVLDQVGSRSWQAIEYSIQSIPPELNTIYQSLMENAGSDSVKLVQWICFSTRPLSLDELRWAMFIEPDCCYLSLAGCEGDADFIPNDGMMKKMIGKLSCGLIETKQVSNSTHIVQFIHQSVKDYFINEFLGCTSFPPRRRHLARAEAIARTKAAHRRLSQICLRYLAIREIQELTHSEPETEIYSFSFLKYTVTSWVTHLRRSDIEGMCEWLPTAYNIEQWITLYQILSRYAPDCPPRGTTLIHILSRYGVVGALRSALPTRYDEVDISDENGRTPLSWAAASGREDSVSLLLATNRVRLNTKDRDGWTPLWYAAANMHEPVILMLLIGHQASINETDNNGQTVMTWAASNGHAAVTKLLFSTGKACTDAKDGHGWTPLLSAAYHGHEDIVEQLLNFNVGLAWDAAFDAQLLQLGAAAAATIFAEFMFGVCTRLLMMEMRATGVVFNVGCALPFAQLFAIAPALYHRTWMGGKLERRRLLSYIREELVDILITFGAIVAMSAGLAVPLPESLFSLVMIYPLWCAFGSLPGLYIGSDACKDLRWPFSRQQLIPQKAITEMLLPRKTDGKHSTGSIDVCSSGWYGRTLLVWAMERRNCAVINLLLAKGRIDVNYKDRSGRTLLLWAAENGYTNTVQILLDMPRVTTDDKDNRGDTPLLCAARNGHADIVKHLLATGKVSINALNCFSQTPLILAAWNGHKAIVQQLLASPVVEVDAVDNFLMPPLLWAAFNGHEDIVEQLLIRKASVELYRIPLIPGNIPFDIDQGHPPQHYHHPVSAAIEWIHFGPLRLKQSLRAVIRLLLPDVGGILFDRIMDSINENDWYGKALFFWAARQRNTRIIDLLVNTGKITINGIDDRFESIVQQLGTHRENRRHLWPQESARLEPTFTSSMTLKQAQQIHLLSAAASGDAAVVRGLVGFGTVNVNTRNRYSQTPLLLAAMNGHEAIVQQLLALQTVDINAKDFFGYTPLLWAALNKHEGVAQRLLLEGASIDWEDLTLWLWFQHIGKLLPRRSIISFSIPTFGLTLQSTLCFYLLAPSVGIFLGLGLCVTWVSAAVLALRFHLWIGSATQQRAAVVRMLLPDGSNSLHSVVQVDVKSKGWFGRTLLFWAIEGEYDAIANLLVDDYQVDLNGTDALGRTALTRAATEGREAMARLLLAKSHLDVNARDNDGRTALSWAAINGHEAIVKLLIENGSAVTLADKAGRTPLWFAIDKGRSIIAEFLEPLR